MASLKNPLYYWRFFEQRVLQILTDRPYASLAALSAVVVAPLAIQDYLTFLSYGPGGLPYNGLGWLVASLMRLFSREQLSTRLYNDKTLQLADGNGFLPPGFPRRNSSRPRIGPHPVPQRQLSQLPNDMTRRELISRFETLGNFAQTNGLVEIKQSLYERRHAALFVSKTRDWHTIARQTRGEITHVHAGLDGSIHVVLHSEDCKKVIDSGWGQRHGLSGVDIIKRIAGFSLPVYYLLVYAPRDEAEIEVALSIVKASVAFMAGSNKELE